MLIPKILRVVLNKFQLKKKSKKQLNGWLSKKNKKGQKFFQSFLILTKNFPIKKGVLIEKKLLLF